MLRNISWQVSIAYQEASTKSASHVVRTESWTEVMLTEKQYAYNVVSLAWLTG